MLCYFFKVLQFGKKSWLAACFLFNLLHIEKVIKEMQGIKSSFLLSERIRTHYVAELSSNRNASSFSDFGSQVTNDDSKNSKVFKGNRFDTKGFILTHICTSRQNLSLSPKNYIQNNSSSLCQTKLSNSVLSINKLYEI